jgi:hypothetical protein
MDRSVSRFFSHRFTRSAVCRRRRQQLIGIACSSAQRVSRPVAPWRPSSFIMLRSVKQRDEGPGLDCHQTPGPRCAAPMGGNVQALYGPACPGAVQCLGRQDDVTDFAQILGGPSMIKPTHFQLLHCSGRNRLRPEVSAIGVIGISSASSTKISGRRRPRTARFGGRHHLSGPANSVACILQGQCGIRINIEHVLRIAFLRSSNHKVRRISANPLGVLKLSSFRSPIIKVIGEYPIIILSPSRGGATVELPHLPPH